MWVDLLGTDFSGGKSSSGGTQTFGQTSGTEPNDAINKLKPYVLRAVRKEYTPKKLALDVLKKQLGEGKINKEYFNLVKGGIEDNTLDVSRILSKVGIDYNKHTEEIAKQFIDPDYAREKGITARRLIEYVRQKDPEGFKDMFKDKDVSQILADTSIYIPKKKEQESFLDTAFSFARGVASPSLFVLGSAIKGIGKVTGNKDLEDYGDRVQISGYLPKLDEYDKLNDEEKKRVLYEGLGTDIALGLIFGGGTKLVTKPIVKWRKGPAEEALSNTVKNIVKHPEVSRLGEISESIFSKDLIKRVEKTAGKGIKDILKSDEDLLKVIKEHPEFGDALARKLSNKKGLGIIGIKPNTIRTLNKLGGELNANIARVIEEGEKFSWVDLGKALLNIDEGSLSFLGGIGSVGLGGSLITKTQEPLNWAMMPVSMGLHTVGFGKGILKGKYIKEFKEKYGVDVTELPDNNPFKQKFNRLVNFAYANTPLHRIFLDSKDSILKGVIGSVLEGVINAGATSAVVHSATWSMNRGFDYFLQPQLVDQVNKVKSLIEQGADWTQVAIEAKKLTKGVDGILAGRKASKGIEQGIEQIQELTSFIGGEHSPYVKDMRERLEKIDNLIKISKEDPTKLEEVSKELDQLKTDYVKYLESTSNIALKTGVDKEIKQKLAEVEIYKNVLNNIKEQSGIIGSFKKTILKNLAPSEFSYTYNLFSKDREKEAAEFVDNFIGSSLAFIDGIKNLHVNKELVDGFVNHYSEVSQVIRGKVEQVVGRLGLDKETSMKIADELYYDLMEQTLKTIIYKGNIEGMEGFKYGTRIEKKIVGAAYDVISKFFDLSTDNLSFKDRAEIRASFKEMDNKLKKILGRDISYKDILENIDLVKGLEKFGIDRIFKGRFKKVKAHLALKLFGNKKLKEIAKDKVDILPEERKNKTLKEFVRDLESLGEEHKDLIREVLGDIGKKVDDIRDKVLEKAESVINDIISHSKGIGKEILMKGKEYLEGYTKETIDNVLLSAVKEISGEGFDVKKTREELSKQYEAAFNYQMDKLKRLAGMLEGLKEVSRVNDFYKFISDANKFYGIFFSELKRSLQGIDIKNIVKKLSSGELEVMRLKDRDKILKVANALKRKLEDENFVENLDMDNYEKVIDETLNDLDYIYNGTKELKGEIKKHVGDKIKELNQLKKSIKKTKKAIDMKDMDSLNSTLLEHLNTKYSEIVEDYGFSNEDMGVKSIPSENLLVKDLKQFLVDNFDKEISGGITLGEKLGIDKEELINWSTVDTYSTEEVIQGLKEFTVDEFMEKISGHKVFKDSWNEYKETKGYENFWDFLVNTKVKDIINSREGVYANMHVFRKLSGIFEGIEKRLDLYKNGVDRSKGYKVVKLQKGKPVDNVEESEVVDYIYIPDGMNRLFGEEFKNKFGKDIFYVKFDAGAKQKVSYYELVEWRSEGGKPKKEYIDDLKKSAITNYKRLKQREESNKVIFVPVSDTLRGYSIKYETAVTKAGEIAGKYGKRFKNEVSKYLKKEDISYEDKSNLILSLLLSDIYGYTGNKIIRRTLSKLVTDNIQPSLGIIDFVNTITKAVHTNAKYHPKIFATEYMHKRPARAIVIKDNEETLKHAFPKGDEIEIKELGSQEVTDGSIYVFGDEDKKIREERYTNTKYIKDDIVKESEARPLTESKLTYYFDGGIVKGKERLMDEEGIARLFLPYIDNGKVDTTNMERLIKVAKEYGIDTTGIEDYNIFNEDGTINFGKTIELTNNIVGVLTALKEQGITRVIPASSIKDFNKVLKKEKIVKDIELAGEKHLLDLYGETFYYVKDGFTNDKLLDNGTTLSMQSPQHLYGEAGKELIRVIEDYNEVYGDVPEIKKVIEAIEKRDWGALYDHLRQIKGNISQSDSILIKKIFEGQGGLINVSQPNVLRVLSTILQNSVVRRYTLKRGTTNTLDGMPLTIKQLIKENVDKLGIKLDGEFIVASRKNLIRLDKDEYSKLERDLTTDVYNNKLGDTYGKLKSGDYVFGIRYPIGGAKANRGMQVVFIEDMLNSGIPELEYAARFFMKGDNPSGAVYIPGKEIRLEEADFDGDQINIFWGMSDRERVSEKYSGEYSQEVIKKVNDEIESVKESWDTVAKSSYDDYERRVRSYGRSPLMPSIVRKYAKDSVSTTSIWNRQTGVLDWNIFRKIDENGKLVLNPDEEYIRESGRGAVLVQAAVDGNVQGKPGELVKSGETKLKKLFPNLNKYGLLSDYRGNDISFRWIDDFFTQGGIMQFMRKQNDRGESLFLHEVSNNVKESVATYDKVIALKMADNLLKNREDAKIGNFKSLVFSLHRHIILKRLKSFLDIVPENKRGEYKGKLTQLESVVNVRKFYDAVANLVRDYDLPYMLPRQKDNTTYYPFVGRNKIKPGRNRKGEGKVEKIVQERYDNVFKFLDDNTIKQYDNFIKEAWEDPKVHINTLFTREYLPIWTNKWLEDYKAFYRVMGKILLGKVEGYGRQLNVIKKNGILDNILKITENGQISRKVKINGKQIDGVDYIKDIIISGSDSERTATTLSTLLLAAEVPVELVSVMKKYVKNFEKLRLQVQNLKTSLWGDLGTHSLGSEVVGILTKLKSLGFEGETLKMLENNLIDYLSKGKEKSKAYVENFIENPIGALKGLGKEQFENMTNMTAHQWLKTDMFYKNLTNVIKGHLDRISGLKDLFEIKPNEDVYRGLIIDVTQEMLAKMNLMMRDEMRYLKDIKEGKDVNYESSLLGNNIISVVNLLKKYGKGEYLSPYKVIEKLEKQGLIDEARKIRFVYNDLKAIFKDIVTKKFNELDSSLIKEKDSLLKNILDDNDLYEGIIKLYFDQFLNTASSRFLTNAGLADRLTALTKITDTYSREYKRNIGAINRRIKEVIGSMYANKLRNATNNLIFKIYDILSKDKRIQQKVQKQALRYIDRGMGIKEAWDKALDTVLSEEKWNISHLNDKTVKEIEQARIDYASEVSDAMNEYTKTLISYIDNNIELHNTPQRIVQDFKNRIEEIAYKGAIEEKPGYVTMNNIIVALNNFYKTQSLGIAVGRAVVETANAGFTVLAHKYGDPGGVKSLEDVKNKWGFKKDIEGTQKIESWMYGQDFKLQSKFSNAANRAHADVVNRGLSKLNDMMYEFIGGVAKKSYEKPNEWGRQKVYEIEFARQLDRVLETKAGESESKLAYYEYLLTTKDSKLSVDERAVKNSILKEAGRKALKEVRQLFFDYSSNPVFLAHLEQYIPFINFLYNGYRIYLKNPFIWTALYNITNLVFEQADVIDMDEDEFNLLVHPNTPGMMNLSIFGFTPINVDTLRLLPIEPGKAALPSYSWQKMFMPTMDSDYKKFIDGNLNIGEYILKKTSPTAYDIYTGLFTDDKSRAIRRLTYLTTGLGIRDKTYSAAVEAYFDGNYDVFNNSTYLAKLNDWRKRRGLKELTLDDIKAIKVFSNTMKELWGGDRKDEIGYKFISVLLTSQYGKDSKLRDKIYNTYYSLQDRLLTKKLTEYVFNPNFVKKYQSLKKSGIIKKLRKIGYNEHYLDKLDWYASHADLLKEYYQTTDRVFNGIEAGGKKVYDYDGKEDDIAFILALKWKFKTPDGKSESSIIRPTDYPDLLSYYKAKAQLIKQGKLYEPVWFEEYKNNPNYNPLEGGSLTLFYREHLKHTKSEIVTDLENAMGEINALRNLKSLYINRAIHAKGSEVKEQAYWEIVKDIEKRLIDAEASLQKKHPVIYEYYLLKHPVSENTGESIIDKFKEQVKKERENKYKSRYDKSKKKKDWYKSIRNIKDWGYIYKKSGNTPQTLSDVWERLNAMHQDFINNL